MSPRAVQHLRPFTAKNGATVHPLYVEGAYGNSDGGTIYAYDGPAPTDPDHAGFRHGNARPIGTLTWNHHVVQTVNVAEGYPPLGPRLGVATGMWRLACEIDPELRHAPCRERSSDEGEAFVRATNPEQACNNHCGEGCRRRGPHPEPASVRPPSVWGRLMNRLRP